MCIRPRSGYSRADPCQAKAEQSKTGHRPPHGHQNFIPKSVEWYPYIPHASPWKRTWGIFHAQKITGRARTSPRATPTLALAQFPHPLADRLILFFATMR